MILIEMESTTLLSLQGALNRQGGHLSEVAELQQRPGDLKPLVVAVNFLSHEVD